MDQRVRSGVSSGDSKAGRHLFMQLRAAKASILQAGSSDWVVFAGEDGYPDQEADFLRSIVHTIRHELLQHRALAPETVLRWVDMRLEQITAGELVYVTHQLDFVGRGPVSLLELR